jgi:hypothetical protein
VPLMEDQVLKPCVLGPASATQVELELAFAQLGDVAAEVA